MTLEEAKKIVTVGDRPDNPQYKTALAMIQSQGSANATQAGQSEFVDEHGRYNNPAEASAELDRQNLAMSGGSGADPIAETPNPSQPSIVETPNPSQPSIAETFKDEEKTGSPEVGSPESVVEVGSEISKPESTDTSEETAQKQRYKQTAKSILQSYFDNDIDKSTATYFMLNALSTLARNTGKDIGNIAAQFSGGSIDTSDKERSLWEQRQNEIFGNEVSSEVENMVDTPAFRKMQHDINSLTTEEQQIFSQAIDNYIKDKGKDLTVEGLRKQIELLGLNVDAAEWAQLLHQPILNMVNSGKTSQQILGYILGTTMQAGPSLANIGMSFLK